MSLRSLQATTRRSNSDDTASEQVQLMQSSTSFPSGVVSWNGRVACE